MMYHLTTASRITTGQDYVCDFTVPDYFQLLNVALKKCKKEEKTVLTQNKKFSLCTSKHPEGNKCSKNLLIVFPFFLIKVNI
jgi:hypothetical protein